jgi:ketosteroid isomerase-like protein
MRARLLVLLLASPGGYAESFAQDRRSVEATVRSLDDEERVAALKRDVPALERLWSEDFTVNAPNNQVVAGKRAVLDAFVNSGIINFSSFERRVEFIRVDGDIATIMGLETLRPITNAPSAGLRAGQTVDRRFTNIWRRENGTWRLFLRHANVVPRPKPVVRD